MSNPVNWEKPTEVPIFTSCKQAARLLSLSLERKLTFRENLALQIHLLMCKTCNYYALQVRALRTVFVRHEELLHNTPASVDECLSNQAKERIRNLIQKSK